MVCVWFVSIQIYPILMTTNFFCVQSSTDNVAVSVDQFYTIRATLLASIEEEEKAGNEVETQAHQAEVKSR